MYSRGELITAFVWLGLGSSISVLLEVIYLGMWWTLPGGTRVPAPVTILIAFGFTMVLTRTGLLWTKNRVVAGIPLWVWLAGYLSLTFFRPVTGDILIPADVRSILLLLAGLAGGGWPLVTSIIDFTPQHEQTETKH
ncbi:hypothetical protein C1Y63_01595 [Corynebacterium sp. 13CS0277]|nr:hypothetical protein [Corynebacterium sp. 13CS0277]PRQ12354.1 hypothetical protein C1Y63_01595 [Corynebacterium sp. 13CS0277]